MTKTRFSPGQESLFDEAPLPNAPDPAPNSPEDLGYRAPQAPETDPAGPSALPEARAGRNGHGPEPRASHARQYGEPSPEPDPYPRNMASSAIQIEDARTFVAWLAGQDIPVHADCTIGHVLVGLSGLGREDMRWLCGAIRQAARAPSPAAMREAVLTHDVSRLRPDDDDD